MNYDGCHRGLVRVGKAKKNDCGTLYVKELTDVLQEQAEVCGKDDIVLFMERGSALS